MRGEGVDGFLKEFQFIKALENKLKKKLNLNLGLEP